nr:hypothetical protein [Tanacetum cinerariifolium]
VLSLSSFSDFPAMFKNDTKNRICTLSKNDLKDLVKTYRIPQDLHPRLPDPEFTMDRLPGDAIGISTKAIPDYLTWRHSCSCISDDLLTDGYDQNDVERLCARLIRIREMREEMSIYDFMTLSSWSDAKVVEESYNLSSSLLDRVSSHTTAPTAEGAMILLPTADEIDASLSDPRLAKKSKGLSQARVHSYSDNAPEPS